MSPFRPISGRRYFSAWLLPLCLSVPLFAQQVDINTPIPNDVPLLTVDDVNTVIAQAVGYLKSVSTSGIIAVADREGHILAIFRMNTSGSFDIRINEQATVKARTASFFESNQNAFSSVTAQFIVQSNFPPGIRNVDAGPLFGVPLSNFPGADVQLQAPPAIVFVNPLNAPGPLAAPAGTSDIRPLSQPLVITPLTDDPGGLPLYKGKKAVGSVGIEIDGFGVLGNGVPDAGVGRDDTGIVPSSSKRYIEETAALAASKGFEAPPAVRGDKVVVNGFRFPYITSHKKIGSTPVAVADLPAEGKFEPYFDTNGSERSASGVPLAGDPYAAVFDPKAVTLTAPRGTPAQEFPRQGFVARFPPRDSPLGAITKADVMTMVQQAADQAFLTRGAIRLPKGARAEVWITVVDLNGDICGLFRTNDATVFSFDLCVQKARTAAFFSSNTVGFSSRAIGFISQTYYPPGVDQVPTGPISGLNSSEGGDDAGALGLFPAGNSTGKLTEISQLLIDRKTNTIVDLANSLPPGTTPAQVAVAAVQLLSRRLPHTRDGRLSPLQVGITVDIGLRPTPPKFLRDGICIFPGGVPIYKNGVLVGGLGVSGDGVDQDDYIAFAGHKGFEPPNGIFCDQASETAIVAALQTAVQKLKLEFPNLTNGSTTSPAVIDVIASRLATGPVLQGLRLPYVKFPRSANRK